MSFETHDRSLKYLLAQDPASFIHFGFPSVPTRVLRPVEIAQPVRHRVIDGGYRVQQTDAEQVIQVEFLRRHQSLAEVACEVGQVQLRLHLRERTREKLMESSLYLEIFQEGEAEGKAEGEARGKAEGEARLLIRLLIVRLVRVAQEVRQAILAQAQTDPEVNSVWFDELAAADTTEAAQRVLRKITAV